jgi:hypothetical protein
MTADDEAGEAADEDGARRPSADSVVTATTPTPAKPSGPASGGRRALAGLGLLALVASAAVGGNVLGLRDRIFGSATPRPEAAAAGRESGGLATGTITATTAPLPRTALRSQPWWQGVGPLQGTGAMTTPAFDIAAGAIQWRVNWSCQSGHLLVGAPGERHPLVDAACPGTGSGYATRPGTKTLQVTADGPWQLQVQQQLDVPLVEPPLPAMTQPGAKAVATGSFYGVEQTGVGRMTVYRLADGRFALRLEDFFVSANVDLEIRLSALAAPRSTEQFTGAPSSGSVAALDVTAGSLNFALAEGVDPTRYRSVVIWCPITTNAYAAASLTASP